MATKTTVAPSWRRRSASSRSGSVARPSSAKNSALPSATRRRSTMPTAPLPAGASKSDDAPEFDLSLGCRGDDRRGERMLAGALDARGKPQQRVLVEILRRHDGESFGLPSVSVPVLSTTRVSTFSMRSRASAFLIRMPACAARPTPTMIDIGVARPSAQGQAMISTVTAATSAKAKRGCGPKTAQAANASSAADNDRRHEPGGDLIGEPRDRRARALRGGDHLHDPRQHRVAADLFRAHDEAAALVERSGDEAWRRLAWSTGIDSPVTIDSSIDDLAFDQRRRRPAPVRPGERGSSRPPRRRRAARPRRCRPPRTRRAVLGARSSARGSRSRSRRGHAVPAPARAAPAR